MVGPNNEWYRDLESAWRGFHGDVQEDAPEGSSIASEAGNMDYLLHAVELATAPGDDRRESEEEEDDEVNGIAAQLASPDTLVGQRVRWAAAHLS